MTIDQKVEAYRMRLEGATLQSIADHFEVSLEWIRQIVPPIEGKTWSLEGMRNRCVYPGIAQWLYENRWMNGVHKPNKPTIDKILKVTGMTYEQAFGEEESSQPEEAAGLG